MKAKNARFQYYLTASRSNGEAVFFCNSATQGPGMIPFAHSMAKRFDARKEAEETAGKMAIKWRGLNEWRVNREERGISL